MFSNTFGICLVYNFLLQNFNLDPIFYPIIFSSRMLVILPCSPHLHVRYICIMEYITNKRRVWVYGWWVVVTSRHISSQGINEAFYQFAHRYNLEVIHASLHTWIKIQRGVVGGNALHLDEPSTTRPLYPIKLFPGEPKGHVLVGEYSRPPPQVFIWACT